MKSNYFFVRQLILALWLALAQVIANAQRPTLGILEVRATSSIEKSAEKLASTNEMMRIVESLGNQLISTISGTERFQIIARRDLGRLLMEQSLTDSGNLNLADPNTAKAFKVAGIKYGLIVTVSDFQDHTATMTFGNLNQKYEKRTFRLSTVSKIYNTTTGALLQAPSFTIPVEDPKKYLNKQDVTENSRISDELMEELSKRMAAEIARAVMDYSGPAKVIGKPAGRQISIDMGGGTGVKRDQVWELFELGDVIIKGETPSEDVRDERLIGRAKIIRVNPKFSQAELLEGTDASEVQKANEKGIVLRLPQDSEPKASPPDKK